MAEEIEVATASGKSDLLSLYATLVGSILKSAKRYATDVVSLFVAESRRSTGWLITPKIV